MIIIVILLLLFLLLYNMILSFVIHGPADRAQVDRFAVVVLETCNALLVKHVAAAQKGQRFRMGY